MKLIKQLDIVSLLLLFILSFNFIENISSSPILQCLDSIEGALVYPDDTLFPSLVTGQNIRVNYTPSVLVYAINNEDVQKTVNCAARFGKNITARSGGHSSEKYGLGGSDNYIVCDVTFINGITVDRISQTAKIGAGNRLGDVYNKLYQEGYFIPAGNCPSVGIAGHALAGGYGFYSRKYSLACDNINSIEMVDANGKVLEIDGTNSGHSDLFFALRGSGGGNYGIVTHFNFSIHPIPPIVTFIHLEFSTNITQVKQLFDYYNNVGPLLDDDIVLKLKLEKKNSEKKLYAYGLYLGNRTGAEYEVNRLLTNESDTEPIIIPISTEYDELTFFQSVERLASLSEPPFKNNYEVLNPVYHPNFFKAKTFFADEGKGLNSDGVDVLMEIVDRFSCNSIYVTFELFGGAINRHDRYSTSFIHRDKLYFILMEAGWASKEQTDKCVKEIDDYADSFQSVIKSDYSYQAFMDRDLKHWPKRYYGEILGNLSRIKRDYDPKCLFKFPQSIPGSCPCY